MSLTAEIVEILLPNLTLKIRDIWNYPSFITIRSIVFIFWEPLPPTFLKVNFDGSVVDGIGGTRFVIKGSDSRLIVAGGIQLVHTTVPRAELRAAYEGIIYARMYL